MQNMSEVQFCVDLVKLLEQIPERLIGRELKLNGQWSVIIVKQNGAT